MLGLQKYRIINSTETQLNNKPSHQTVKQEINLTI